MEKFVDVMIPLGLRLLGFSAFPFGVRGHTWRLRSIFAWLCWFNACDRRSDDEKFTHDE